MGFGLDEAALNTVHDWLVSPATREGVPISVVVDIDVPFSVRTTKAFKTWQGWPNITQPTVLSKVVPVYTEEARRAELQGMVILEAVVMKDGTVGAIRVVQGLQFGLTDSAIDALRQWKFRPGKKDGQDADVAMQIGINFHLPQGK